ncbi:MAG TPA: hypothetical protein VHG51_05115, partial [Longimicrobiaceae bacterium]|nr:hypothetical protein [Longimicrobiaceae bacterium]
MSTTSEEQRPASLWEAVIRQMPAAVVVVDARTGEPVLASARAEQGPAAPAEWPPARPPGAGDALEAEEVAFRRADGSEGVCLLSSASVRD